MPVGSYLTPGTQSEDCEAEADEPPSTTTSSHSILEAKSECVELVYSGTVAHAVLSSEEFDRNNASALSVAAAQTTPLIKLRGRVQNEQRSQRGGCSSMQLVKAKAPHAAM